MGKKLVILPLLQRVHCRYRYSLTRNQHIQEELIVNPICLIKYMCYSLIFLGDFIQLGEAITFRFNHPKEALRLKQVCAELPSIYM